MAMDALKNLSNNVPGWLKQLDELSGQIDLRQAELAAVAAAEGKNPETKSLRNKGSTESLRPKDDVPMTSAPEATPDDTIPEEAPAVATEPSTPPTDAKKEQVAASPPSPSALKQSQEAIKAARARARQVKRRQRSSSMVSAEGAPAAYRTRTMIIVYYDSYVQGFFDNLVRFVSSSRNLMRKAKMAAKVAQIKRLAEVDMSEGNEDGDDEPLPSLRYMSTRRGYGPAGANGQPPDVYDRLDKSLEIVQSMCEHGAHQFLRDGDCNDEISKVQKQLTEVLEVSTTEIERIQREEPELAKETGELGKIRTRRPISMRREMSPGLKDGSPLTPNKGDPEKLEAAKPEDRSPHLLDAEAPLEVDPNIIEADEGIDVAMEVPKLQYRSTRAMRSRGP
ncbi:hypothetical protein EDB81DRAFT_886606 [Dactylonectria macrodidyma]|uniref:Uncharacterized protein n=1 Tax=Dactylonectria macrodidyma TaxID=307937 RepID=A0A9P9EEQ3_9HYPO|nr:hypothetical protein EDB81DRAFT_886606 [Dactylonectria macrodidyma]